MRLYRFTALVAAALALMAAGIQAVYVAPSGQFNATENVTLNWSAGVVNVTANYTNIILFIDNSSTAISPSYFSSSDYPTGTYAALTSDAAVRCLGAAGSAGTKFYIINSTGSYENTTRPMNTSQYSVFSIYAYADCPPGKYYGNFSVKNLTGPSDYVGVTATANVPISPSNTVDSSRTGFFRGSMSTAEYHSYYFWTNATTNVTYVTINLTGLTGDVDLFLLDSQGRLLNESLSTGTDNETIEAKLPSTPDVWELRIGNVTSSYRGYVHYSTLSSSPSSISFSPLSPNQTSSTTTFSLSNLANFSITNVNETKELYRLQEWRGSAAGDFQVVVPAFAEKVKIRIEWANESGKNMTDWDVHLRDANQALVGSSTSKSLQAIGSNVSAAEYVIYTGTISEANDGLWNITVANATNTGTLCSFNLTAQVWVNASQWINTNFTAATTFNQSGNVSSSYAVAANITVPRYNLTGGAYAGSIRYSNGSGWVYVVPLSFNVTAGTLLINGNLSNSTYRVEDNIGINRTGANALQISIPVNNTGDATVYFVSTSPQTSGSLINAIYPTRYMNITTSSLPALTLNAGYNTTLTLTVTINTTETANTQDVYRGWVFFNTTNSVISRSSYPYETYNLTVEVNLSSSLNVTITSVSPGQILNMTSPNITATASVRLMNGSLISNTGIMDSTNFTSMTITERNVSSYTNTTSTIGNAGAVTCAGGVCSVNGTMPSNLVGGNYTVSLAVRYNTGGANLTGTGTYQAVAFNNTGLYIESVSGDLGEVGEGRTTYANFTVTNYGMRNATNAHVTFNKGDCPITVTTYNQGCSSTTSSATYTSTIPGNGTQCWYNWKIVASSITGTTTCSSLSVTVSDYATMKNATSLSLQINNLDTSTTTNAGMSGSSCTTSTNCVWNYKCVSSSCTLIQCSDPDKHIVEHECTPYIDRIVASDHTNISANLGGYAKATIKVKNDGDRALTGKLNVTTPAGITAAVSPADCTLSAGAYCYFTVNFSVSASASVGNQKCHYTAYSTNKTSVNNAQVFYFNVIPTDERKSAIEDAYASYSAMLSAELSRLSALRFSGLSADNMSKLEALLNQTRDMLLSANISIASSNYGDAESALVEVNATFRRISSMLEAMGVANIGTGFLGIQPGTWIIIAAVAGCIIIAAIVVYMLLPPKGYPTSYKAYVKPEGPGLGKRLSGFLRKLKDSTKKSDKFTYKYKP